MKYAGIALCGKTKCGKDSTMNALRELDSRFARLSFADRLKDICTYATGLDFQNPVIREEHRELLKLVGTAFREYNQDFWVNFAMSKLHLYQLNIPVVTDCRYLNEATTLHEAGFLLVRLEVKPETIVARGGKISSHASETELDELNLWDKVFQSEEFTPEQIAKLIYREFK